jgi:hypothetical protein
MMDGPGVYFRSRVKKMNMNMKNLLTGISVFAICIGAGFGIRAIYLRYKQNHQDPDEFEEGKGELDDIMPKVATVSKPVVQIEESSGLSPAFVSEISPFSSAVSSAQKAASAPIKPGTGFVSPIVAKQVTTTPAAATPLKNAKPAAARRTVQKVLNVSGSDPENGYLVW